MEVEHTGTISEVQANVQTEAVKAVMAETGLNFGDAFNEWLRRRASWQSDPGCENCKPEAFIIDMSQKYWRVRLPVDYVAQQIAGGNNDV